MNTIPSRIVIYPKDVMNITGRSERTARRLLARLRKQYKKETGAFITVEEFCMFTGFKEDKIIPFLK